jgi:hypothetical protein
MMQYIFGQPGIMSSEILKQNSSIQLPGILTSNTPTLYRTNY